MKFQSKSGLIDDANQEWDQLWRQLSSFSTDQLEQRKGRGNSARSMTDHLAHVHAWHRLFLGWVKTGRDGQPDLPAKGYKWNQTPQLNQEIFEEFKEATFVGIRRKLKLSHGRVFKLVQSLSDDELFRPGTFSWTGKLGLASYAGPSLGGHYRWALKKLKNLKRTLSNE